MVMKKKSFMEEIKEQGAFLRKLVDYYSKEGEKLLDEAGNMITAASPHKIISVGMGTSCIAPGIIPYILANKTSVLFSIWDAGEFLHYGMNSAKDEDIIIAISQSGESIETRKCVESLRKHSRIITITNNPDSTMAKLSGLNLSLLAGEEKSISNKTYTNTMALLLLLGYKIIGEPIAKLLEDFLRCAEEMDVFFSQRSEEINEAGDFLKSADSLHFIARGPTVMAARQASLTWMEGVHMTTSAFPGGSFRHGPFELVGENHYAVCYAPEGKGGDLVERMAKEIAGLGSKVVIFSGKKIQREKNLFPVEISPPDENTFSIAAAVPQELLLAKMAQDRGLIPGIFKRINKITNEE